MVVGAAASRTFSPWLPVQFQGTDSLKLLNAGSEKAGGITGLKTRWQKVLTSDATNAEGWIYSQSDYRYSTPYPVATVHPLGAGYMGVVYLDFSEAYQQYKSLVLNQLIANVVDRILPEKDLYVEGSDKVHVVLGKKGKSTLVHLINVGGDHANKSVMRYDEVLPLKSIAVRLRYPSKPASVKLQPEGKKLPFKYKDGFLEVNIASVPVHSIVEINPTP